MKKSISILILSLCFSIGFSQETKTSFDEKLAKSLDADAYGMKQYVFCILKTGSNTTATKEERKKLFEGHMANINKLAAEGKLVIAGPFLENDKNYRGIFVFNVKTVEEAQKLVATDPAVQAKLFDVELTPWYSSAALQQISKLHAQIAKEKF
ncbi:YciI family protein [Flavobacterium acetivorans]|uniref:YciI family protein n=1 Tax=Flavobacterium acetivorans TaxID=2893883 RepID=UPI001E3C02CA|nr:YciI family protein [Flavobacterium sp. F-29]UFH34127.1 YciI family protein [Flavobacterium sp. F-29]